MDELPDKLPRGTRAKPHRGGLTAESLARGLGLAIDARWGTHDVTALELFAVFRQHGWLDRLVREPSKITAGAAVATLARISPLLERISHGIYRVHACRPDCLPPAILETLLERRFGDASVGADSGETLSCAAGFDASASAPPLHQLSAPDVGNRERAWGGPTKSSGEQLWLAFEDLGAVACSSSAPAETAGARPHSSPARAALEPGASFTRSGWMQAIPLRKHLQRAAALALRYFDDAGERGTAAVIAAWLAGFEGTASSRSRASLARALTSLAKRGLLVVEGDVWRVPTFVEHPELKLFEVPETPDARPVSPGLAAQLERNDIDPAGLSQAEARALSQRLWSRKDGDLARPRTIHALIREQALADLPVDLRATRRLDHAAARDRLAQAMRARGHDLWAASDFEVQS